jgi:uncharacterized protein YycO
MPAVIPAVSVIFYPGGFPGGTIVRAWTRSAYGHVSLMIQGMVYEAVAAGVSKHVQDTNDATATIVDVECADPHALLAWCESKLGCPYDWGAVLMSGLGQRLPGGYHLLDTRQGSYDCSRFVARALGLMDYSQPCPPSPGWLYERLAGG